MAHNNTSLEISRNRFEYFSKDKDIIWYTTPSRDNTLSRASAENIIRGCMGVTSFAVQRISNIIDTFSLCLTDTMKKNIIRFSNMEGRRVYKDNYIEIDDIEFDAYLGNYF